MENPLISVIVPIYNVEKYLDKCVDSIVNQTYKNLEIILVDDGSPDNCPEICDEWAKKDGRIKVIHKENGDLPSARNAGLKIMRGKYVTFIDSDDYVDSDYISSLYENSIGFDVVVGGFAKEYEDHTELVKFDEKVIEGEDILFYFLLDKFRPEVCGKLYSCELIKNIRFDERLGYAEDVPFNFSVLKKASRLHLISDCKYRYVQYNTSSKNYSGLTEKRVKAYKLYKTITDECKNNKKLYDAALWRFVRIYIALISLIFLDGERSYKYYDDTVDAVLEYKFDILKNPYIDSRHKSMVLMLTISRKLFKTLAIKRFGK